MLRTFVRAVPILVGFALPIVSGCATTTTQAALAAQPSADTAVAEQAAINDLLQRYVAALDADDPDAYAACFTDDGVLIAAGKTRTGRTEIKTVLTDIPPSARRPPGSPRPPLRHVTTNDRITLVDATHARHTGYWMSVQGDGPKNVPTIRSVGRYDDELVKTSGGWLFSKRAILRDMPSS